MKFNHLLYHLPQDCPRKEQRLLSGHAFCSILLFAKNVNYLSQHEPRDDKGKASAEFGLMDNTFPTPKQNLLPFAESLYNAQGVPPWGGFILGMNQHFVCSKKEKTDLFCHTAFSPRTLSASGTSYGVQINLRVAGEPLGKD